MSTKTLNRKALKDFRESPHFIIVPDLILLTGGFKPKQYETTQTQHKLINSTLA